MADSPGTFPDSLGPLQEGPLLFLLQQTVQFNGGRCWPADFQAQLRQDAKSEHKQRRPKKDNQQQGGGLGGSMMSSQTTCPRGDPTKNPVSARVPLSSNPVTSQKRRGRRWIMGSRLEGTPRPCGAGKPETVPNWSEAGRIRAVLQPSSWSRPLPQVKEKTDRRRRIRDAGPRIRTDSGLAHPASGFRTISGFLNSNNSFRFR
jgi:hypothetical protein